MTPGVSDLTARVSRGAVEHNARALVAASSEPPVADLRLDAWGHDVAMVAHAVLASGFAAVVADRDATAVVDPASRAPLGTPIVDANALLGLDGDGRPVLTLSSRVVGVKPLRAGEGVSYGYVHRAPADTRIALVSGGYAQGIVRALGTRATVCIAGRRHPIVGRIAMDACVVDIGDAAVDVGDEVVMLGDPDAGEPTVREWAELTGLTPAEIAVLVGLRAPREVVE